MIDAFFRERNIPDYALLPIEACRVRNPALLARLFPMQKPVCVVLFLMPYYVSGLSPNLSRYAVCRDYHCFVAELSRAARKLPNCLGACADHSPIDEREAVFSAGLCLRGENGLALHETWGSYFFIGELYFSEYPYPYEARSPRGSCPACHACRAACPGRLSGKGECLSAVSQKKTVTEEEARLLQQHGILWGCDVCQQVCPMNRDVPDTPIPYFREALLERLTAEGLEVLLQDGEFSSRAYAWRGAGVIARNLALLEERGESDAKNDAARPLQTGGERVE